jgi:hypothetical protein
MRVSMNFKFQSLIGMTLLLAITSCNMPFEQLPAPNDVQTAAALTVQALLTPTVRAETSTPSAPVVTRTSSPSATATTSITGSPTTTITPTFSVPMLTILESTNCRTGPGEEYDIVFTYLTGKELEIAGRYDLGNFWLVKSNESPTGTCWLWGGFAEVTGSYWAVSSVTPPPTATSAPPRQPGILEWNFSCSEGNITFSVNWADNAMNEAGYRIFRNGEAIVDLPADSITYTDVFDIAPDQSVEYYIQAFAPSGTANSSIMRMRCG